VTNSTASNSGAINVNYYMTVKDNFSNCSTQDPKCTDAKGTLSDPVNGLRLVAIRCFSDEAGTANVACESASLRSVRLVKGVMETIWPGGATNATTDIAGVVRDRNATVQYGNVGGTGSEQLSTFPGLPNDGKPDEYFGRPIVFSQAGALSTQPISVKINPRRNDTSNPALLGSTTLTNTSNPVVQGSDVLRIGGTRQDLDGNWRKKVVSGAGSPSPSDECAAQALSTYSSQGNGCGAEVVGVPIQSLSNPNCNGLATAVANRAVVNATGNNGSQAGPGANATVVSVNQAALSPQVFSSQSHGACFMGGSEFEKNSPIVLSPRINNQLMAAGGGDTPRILSDIPAQSLFDQVNTIAGLAAGKSDNLALIVYLPSWATQSTQDETGTTALTVQSRQTLDAQNNPVAVPIGGAGNKAGGKASYTVAFTAVQPVGQTFALANVAQQSVNTLAALAGQIQTNSVAFQAQSSDVGSAGANLITGGIQTLSPNNLPGNGRQIISVTGRGFAKVTGVPQNVKAEGAAGGGLASQTYRYVVTAATTATPQAATINGVDLPANQMWTQGEVSTEVSVNPGATGQVTITWNHVPGATHYNVYRDVVLTGTTPSFGNAKRISVVYDSGGGTQTGALARTAPTALGFVSGSTVGVVDNGLSADVVGPPLVKATAYADDAGATYPAYGRPCAAYASPAVTFGYCPKIEILSGTIGATGGTNLATGVFDTRSTSLFAVRTGEVLKGVGVVRTGEATTVTPYSRTSSTGLLQLDAGATTLASTNVLALTANTVGYQSSNQVSFEVQTPDLYGLTLSKYGVRITNPNHPSLPLDVRGKVLVLSDSISVQPQAIDAYTPGSIGRISTGNTLVIKGSGFQKGSIVQLGVHTTAACPTGTAPTLTKSGLVTNPPAVSAPKVSGTNCFVSKSHILNRDGNTRKELGTWYAAGYNSETAVPGTVDPVTGLASKDLAVGAQGGPLTDANALPWFSFDHNKVEVNNAGQITIKDITVTNVADAPVGVAAKVFNPDGSVVIGATFGIAAPGIEQIVQVDTNGAQWLSAAQAQTVKLRFQASSPNTFMNSATGLPPTVRISCYATATSADVAAGFKLINPDGTSSTTTVTEGGGFDPCLNASTGATTVGVTQVGDLKVIARSAMGDAVEGTFSIAPDAKVALRKFIMTNGDAAVFSNYFSISQAPTFSKLSYTSGTNRIVTDLVASSTTVGGTTTTLATTATKGFNVEGRLPRGATRRVLVTGSGFVRGSFAPMVDPMASGSAAAVTDQQNDSECGSCFGYRSNNTSLVNSAHTPIITPKIEFSNTGVSVAPSQTTVVRDAGTQLSIQLTTGQSTDLAQPYIATQRLTAVVTVAPGASAGPVTMTITNPDGGKVIVPNAFVVDGVPTIDVTRNSAITGTSIVTDNDASIKQGEQKLTSNAIFIYGSGFFNFEGRTPEVRISGSGVRVLSTRLSKVDPGTSTGQTVSDTDGNLYDTVLRVELAAETTAETGPRNVTVVLPDGQSVPMPNGLRVTTP
ncbi:MAG: hypothetical protein EBT09_03880, partial [Actinobacteria bacterium]|nr:hypothetical protein [Actinomycetota bacterium]